ncbi:MAG TPA: hypothetical protein VFX65_05520 [Candidatus Limnocylindrales bacterium]|nr:hypothetical protein [Candidatus Limnocylindrales bacterium]
MQDIDRAAPGGGAPNEGPNDYPVPSAGTPSDATDAPLPSPAGPLRDLGDDRPDSETERRDELAERAGVGMPSPAGRDRPDILPDVEPPDHPM